MVRLALLGAMLGCGVACGGMVDIDTSRLGDGATRDALADDGAMSDSEPDAAADGNDSADAPQLETGVDAGPTCTDLDGDGYGDGPACLGLDCDDVDAQTNPAATEDCNDTDDNCNGLIDEGLSCPCSDGETRACYTGPSGTLGVGVCAAGIETCTSGLFGGACVGEIGPAAEACDGRDDNCNGAIDEGLGNLTCGAGACERTVSACVAGVLQACVAGSGSPESCDLVDNDCDGTTDEEGACACVHARAASCCRDAACPGSESEPFCTISEAIARATLPGGLMRVCVAAAFSGSCSAQNYDEAITMVEGLKLHGHFDPSTSPWSRSNAACITRIRATNALGVYFPPGTTRATEIDGFRIVGASSSGGGPMAAVTFTGSSGVLANSRSQAGSSPECYGVLATEGGSPLITGDTLITGGNDSATTAAVRCIETALEVRGIATDTQVLALQGGSTVSGVAHGLWATDCVGLSVDGAVLSGGNNRDGRSAGIFFEGNNSGVTVTGSTIVGGSMSGSGEAHGLWLSSCTGTEPWIAANKRIVGGVNGNASSRAYGVYAQAGCDVAIEQNDLIVGGFVRTTRAIACVEGAQCTIRRNALIAGSGAAGTQSVGIYCGPDSCRDISDNLRILGSFSGGESRPAPETIGVELDRSGPTVRGNLIEGGCGSTVSVGVELNDSYARLVNNIITPGVCAGARMPTLQQYGIRQINGLANEPDVHSNTIDGGRGAGTCTGRAVSIDAGTVSAPFGVYRNNILHAGRCSTRYGLQELTLLAADPRIVENNDFWDATGGAYLNESVTPLNTEAAINGLTDCTSSGNLVREPGFVDEFGDVHLDDASECVDQGTLVGMPADDFDGDSRPIGGRPDIGADERD